MERERVIAKLRQLDSPVGWRSNPSPNDFYFFISCIANKQIPLERAWQLPHILAERLSVKELTPTAVFTAGPDKVREAFTQKPALHRFNYVADEVYKACCDLLEFYDGDAGKLWNSGTVSEVYGRLLSFKGIGAKIASMTIMLLIEFGEIRFNDTSAVDVPLDVHVRRVLTRLGARDTKDMLALAREAFPEFPAKMDSIVFDVAMSYCKARTTNCIHCPFRQCCEFSKQKLSS